MHDYVSGIHKICWQAIKAIEDGNTSDLGLLMNQGQSLFDECAMPNCPDHLTSPRLHQLLNDPALRSYSNYHFNYYFSYYFNGYFLGSLV